MPKITPELRIANITVDKKSKQPLYQQLYDGVRMAILDGTIRPGERLPATRQFALELDVSRNIVSLAFEQLILEGYLTGKVGSGTFVSSNLPDNFIKSQATVLTGTKTTGRVKPLFPKTKIETTFARNSFAEEVIPFQNAVPAFDLFPFRLWNKIAAREYREIRTHHLGYGDAYGYAPLRENIAGYLRSARGVKCEAGQVLIINGTQQGLSLCSHVLLRKGDQVLLEDPGYLGARTAFENYGANIKPVPVEADGVDVDFLTKHCTKAKLIYLT